MGAWTHRLIERDDTNKTGVCISCGDVETLASGSVRRCATAVRQEVNAQKKRRGVGIICLKYKITREQYFEMVADGCEACGNMNNLCIDHDHACCPGEYTCGECIRGVLCHGCNVAEGALRKSKNPRPGLVAYLSRYENRRTRN